MEKTLQATDQWLERCGPESHIVVSSRARYARNLPKVPFPLRAKPDELAGVASRVKDAIAKCGLFGSGFEFAINDIKPVERNFLKENHLISVEMEKGGENRALYLNPEVDLAIMVNEEDHLRIYALQAGLQPFAALNRVVELDEMLNAELGFAFSEKFGFLTACPTNTGTGLRSSVMLHLPALSMTKKLPEIVKSMPQFGLTVRGFYGENSENMGDFFQVSNEVTLGKSEEEIVKTLATVVEQIIEREEQARHFLFDQNRAFIEDEVWRAYGVVGNARVMTSQEAVQLLSKLRLGIDRKYFGRMTHADLNRMVVAVQPGHVQCMRGGAKMTTDERDEVRAEFLRSAMTAFGQN